jgi:hypothetical protein
MTALDHVTSAEEVAWGIFFAAVTMTIHAFAWSTAVLLALAQRFQDEQLRRLSVPAEDIGQ